jgi:hypothetical protein
MYRILSQDLFRRLDECTYGCDKDNRTADKFKCLNDHGHDGRPVSTELETSSEIASLDLSHAAAIDGFAVRAE